MHSAFFSSPLLEPNARIRAFNAQYLPDLEAGVHALPLHISRLQIQICQERARGRTYTELSGQFNLCNKETVSRCILRTALGFHWDRNQSGGRLSYLSDLDLAKFKDICIERGRSFNCATKSQAREIAFQLREDRICSAITFLTSINCQGLLERLALTYPSQAPDDECLRTICEKTLIRICRPQTLELVRRFSCDRPKVERFLNQFAQMFDRDRRLIWNADETQLNAMKRFKVLAERGHLPLVTALEHVPHLTGMVTISGDGEFLPPIVILKNLQHLRDLAEYETHCFFATSLNGWMTKDLWVYYALVFCAQMSQYRTTLPKEIREEDMLLIIDGHKTRISLLAAVIFEMFGVEVLVLPAHCTHLLQMFDVAVAAALKVAFKRELDRRVHLLASAAPGDKAQVMRRILVESFINALPAGATPANIEAGFRQSGVHPFDPSIPLNSDFAVPPVDPRIFQTRSTGAEINEIVLTWRAGLKKLCQIEYGRKVVAEDFQVDYSQVWERLSTLPVVKGRPLTKPPPLFVRRSPTMIEQMDITTMKTLG
jgi:hypothetical protein